MRPVRRSGRALRASSGWYLFASRTNVTVTSLVLGATRAPAFCDGILPSQNAAR